MRLTIKGPCLTADQESETTGTAESGRGTPASLLGLRFKVDEQSLSRAFLKRGRFWPVAEPRKYLVTKLGWPCGTAWVPFQDMRSRSRRATDGAIEKLYLTLLGHDGRQTMASHGGRYLRERRKVCRGE